MRAKFEEQNSKLVLFLGVSAASVPALWEFANDKWKIVFYIAAHCRLNNHSNPLAVLHYLGLARDSLRS